MASVTITVSAMWRREDGDGSRCIACGDSCYLSQRRLVIVAKEMALAETGLVLCSSCSDEQESN